jgi:hypothetical protein
MHIAHLFCCAARKTWPRKVAHLLSTFIYCPSLPAKNALNGAMRGRAHDKSRCERM